MAGQGSSGGSTATDSGLRVAVLGTGIMGSAMARNLIAAGLHTTVWNRSERATAPLADAGAVVARTPQEAVHGARVVITALPTAEATSTVMFADDVTDQFARDAVWAQMGTIGVTETATLADTLSRTRPDVLFVDAPVSGSKGPAEAGDLVVLASGPPSAQDTVEAVFSAIGRKTLWLGPAGHGSALKLVVNAYLSALIEGAAEALELADRLGIDEAAVQQAIQGGPLAAPIVDAKMRKMRSGDFEAEFPLEWALKDVDLARTAAAGARLPLLEALSRQWRQAVQAGHGRQDISAARLALASTGSQIEAGNADA